MKHNQQNASASCPSVRQMQEAIATEYEMLAVEQQAYRALCGRFELNAFFRGTDAEREMKVFTPVAAD
jgi:hypothetical protein